MHKYCFIGGEGRGEQKGMNHSKQGFWAIDNQLNKGGELEISTTLITRIHSYDLCRIQGSKNLSGNQEVK